MSSRCHRILIALGLLAGIVQAEDRGGILHEYWLNISGNSLSALTSDARYPASPSGVGLPSSFSTPINMADSYGSRVRGHLYPPVTGTYRFWVAGDDQCELWLSTTDVSANKVLIASTYSYTGPQEWTKYASQQSVEITLQAGSRYYIEALHKEGGGQDSLAVAWTYPGVERQVIPGEFLSPAAPLPIPGTGTGFIQREWWSGLTGTAITDLTNAAAFPATPTGRDYLAGFEAPIFWGDNYGTRIRGFLKPTQTGDYQFWISGDDNCQLWLSHNADPLQKGLIATVPGHTATREWTKYPQQHSIAITLQAGESYYIEALHKEGGGGDSVAVAWTGPGIGETPTVIAGSFLSPAATANPSVPTSVGTGSIAVESWNGISGNNLTALTAAPTFPLRPASRSVLTSFKASTNAGDNYGRRVRGYLCPAITGSYRFWIASDDEGELRLSSDETVANATIIARAPTWTGETQWDKFAEQQSALITLTGGQRYYIEARQKEGTGGDHLAVAWVGPSLIKDIIPGAYLAPLPLPIIDGVREFTTSTTATLSATVSGATIRYTTDGTTPTVGSPIYSSSLTISSSTVITAAIDVSGVIGEATQAVFLKQGTGTGLAGSYFVGEALQGTPVQRLDPVLQFTWGTGAPISGIPADHFSARWQGEIETQLNEAYTLILRSDDGVRVWLDGNLVLNDWTYHGATDRTCVLPPGRHSLAIEYMEGAVQAELQMFWQSAHQERRIVPSTQLYPLQGVQGTIPPSSPVSPTYLQFTHETGATLNATVAGNAIPTHHLDDTIRYLNVPLDSNQATAVTVSTGSGSGAMGSITWSTTTLEGHRETTIRKSDSLLLEFPQPGSVSITNYSGTYYGPVTVTTGQRLPVLFSKAGEFTVRLTSQGVEVATLEVTVVTADLTRTVLCEVGFTRDVDVEIDPFDAPITFIGNSQLLVTTEAIAQDLANLHVTPLRRGTPRLQARINGAQGPLIAEQEIHEFTIDSAALHSATIDAKTGIGTISLVMRPHIPAQIFTMTMFAHRATFKGGATSLTINSTGGSSSNGEPPMAQKFDTATNETIGVFRFDLELPDDESKYCFRVARNQDEEGEENGAHLPNAGAIFGLQAAIPASVSALLIGSHTGSGDGPTTNVNGDVCHVLAHASLLFTQAVDSSEDETGPSSNSETWQSRTWSLLTEDYCVKGNKGDSSCSPVSYKLKVSDPPGAGNVDNALAALFGGSNKESDCKSCTGSCGPVTPAMDTGTTPGKYTTSVEVCGVGNGDTLGESVGGVFYIAKLDIHGEGSSTRSKFPDYVETIPKLRGTVYDPVIQIEKGGELYEDGEVSLYGIGTEGCTNPCDTKKKNRWKFKAVAKDPQSLENVPSGYYVRWRLSNFNYESGSQTPMPGVDLNSGSTEVETCFGPGRWYPRLEVWATKDEYGDALESPKLVGIAEIHSLAVELVETTNVSADQSTVPASLKRGRVAKLTNNSGGPSADARIKITGGASDGDPENTVRGRVSLNGYPQNQFWVKENDDYDPPQVALVQDGQSVDVYLQGYQLQSQSEDDLTVSVEGQAFIEQCIECGFRTFEAGLVRAEWQPTDTEKFSSYAIEWRSLDRESGDIAKVNRFSISNPAPVITVTSSSVQVDNSGSSNSIGVGRQVFAGTISVSGTIKSAISDFIEGDKGTIDSISVRAGYGGPAVGDFPVSATKTGDGSLPRPYPYDGSFSLTASIPNLNWGQNTVLLVVEDKFFGAQTTQELVFFINEGGGTNPPSTGSLAKLGEFANPILAELDLSTVTSVAAFAPRLGDSPKALATRLNGSSQTLIGVADSTGKQVYQFDQALTQLQPAVGVPVSEIKDMAVSVLHGGYVILDDFGKKIVVQDFNGVQLGQSTLQGPAYFDSVATLANGSYAAVSGLSKQVALFDAGFQPVGVTTYADPSVTFGNPASLTADLSTPLAAPTGSVFDENGNLYLSESGNNRVLRFDLLGNLDAVFYGAQIGDADLLLPKGLAVASDGDILVVDSGHGRVLRLSPSGVLKATIGAGGLTPGIVAVAEHGGTIVVLDSQACQVVGFTAAGNELFRVGAPGAGIGQFANPQGLALDSQGDIYVADTGNNRVVRLNASAAWQAVVISPGTAPGLVQQPGAIAIQQMTLALADVGNQRIQVFSIPPTAPVTQLTAADELPAGATSLALSKDLDALVVVALATGDVMRFSRTQPSRSDAFIAGAPDGTFRIYSQEEHRVYKLSATGSVLSSVPVTPLAADEHIRATVIDQANQMDLLVGSSLGLRVMIIDEGGTSLSSIAIAYGSRPIEGAIDLSRKGGTWYILNAHTRAITLHSVSDGSLVGEITTQFPQVPFTAEFKHNNGLPVINAVVEGSSSGGLITFHGVGQALTVTVSEAELGAALVATPGTRHAINATLFVGAWRLQKEVALVESAPGSKVFRTRSVSGSVTITSPTTLTANLQIDGSVPYGQAFTMGADPTTYLGTNGAFITLKSSVFSGTKADALQALVTIPDVGLAGYGLDLLETTPQSLTFASSLVINGPSDPAVLQYSVTSPETVIDYTEEELHPMVIRVNGIFGDSEVDTLKVRLPSGLERQVIKNASDDKYYIADPSRSRVSVNLFIGKSTWGIE